MGKAIVNKSSMSQPTIAPPPVQGKAIVNSYKKKSKAQMKKDDDACGFDVEKQIAHNAEMIKKEGKFGMKRVSKNGRVKSHLRTVKGKGNTTVRSHMRKSKDSLNSRINERGAKEQLIALSGAIPASNKFYGTRRSDTKKVTKNVVCLNKTFWAQLQKKTKIKSHARAIVN